MKYIEFLKYIMQIYIFIISIFLYFQKFFILFLIIIFCKSQ